ncbi:MAG TPA: hypothetical protein DDZ89_18815 [Clostridiales bacterium]|nr:hypothetical protein [Clostridiales bacterium]
MNVTIIPSDRSLTVSNECYKKNLTGRYLYVGKCQWCVYNSFIGFDLRCLPHGIKLCRAELVLHTAGYYCKEQLCNLYVCPLKDEFDCHTNYENQPDCLCRLKNDSPIGGKETISFDITRIVGAWLSNACLNRGLKLGFDCIHSSTPLLTFYSADCNNERQVPYLKVSYYTCTDHEEDEEEEEEKCKDKCEHKDRKSHSPGEAVGCLLESIALEEKMIAQLIKAESDKIQKVICIPGCSVDDLLDANESVNKTLKNIFKVEALLQFKLENIAKMMKYPSKHGCD